MRVSGKRANIYPLKRWSMSLASVLLAILLSLTAHPAMAQSSSVPSPSEFHGYKLGTTYTITAAIYDYYKELARTSPRV